jgi:hypothetical protein
VEHRGEAYLFLRGFLNLSLIGPVCLAGGVRERAKAQQRQKDAGQEEKQSD